MSLQEENVPGNLGKLHFMYWVRRASNARSFHAFSPLLVGMSYGSDLG